jgi:acetylornithine deacetylase/succinyl-diaminopimelate desuccinylase-like protein
MSALDRASHAWIERGGSILADFAEFLSIPNVASDPKALRAAADWIVGQFRARGIEAIAHSIEGAAPVVMGRISGEADAPTIGIYAHYDGQPVADHRWASPPFTPTLRDAKLEDGGSVIELPDPGAALDPDWRIYARGSADDRAPIVALLAALDAVSITRTTVVFLFEGEEELGSPHLGDYLATLKDQLAADLWLICDGPVHQSGRPQVALGVRGFAEIEIEVFGPPHDLHSGHYGETAVNPAVALAELLVSMRDADGSLHLADLAGPEPSAATVVAAAAVPDPENLGFAPNPHGTYARRLLGPLLNVRGISAGDVGAASRNVIPATAIASIDLRLVAGQNPAEMIEAVRSHVRDAGYHLVDTVPTDAERRVHRRLAKVTGVAGYPGFRTDPTSDVLQRVIAAVESAAGEPPILLPSFGGSVPLHHFVEHLDAPLAILPIANHDNNQHSENENMRLGNLAYGVRVMAALLGDL